LLGTATLDLLAAADAGGTPALRAGLADTANLLLRRFDPISSYKNGDDMDLFILMIIILNPFSQVLYLKELMDRMSMREFGFVNLRADLLSFSVFAIFVFFGEPILKDIFQVRLESLRIFGGFVNLFIAHRFLTVGAGSNVLFLGKPEDLAPTIALPYTVGAGTLWVSILMGLTYTKPTALLLIVGVLCINTGILLATKLLFDRVSNRRETMIGKYFSVLMRTMALLVGAVGVEMILSGLQDVFAAAP